MFSYLFIAKDIIFVIKQDNNLLIQSDIISLLHVTWLAKGHLFETSKIHMTILKIQ